MKRLREFPSMAEVDVATIDRRPTRFYSDIVSPNVGPTLPPQGRGTGHAKHSLRAGQAATPTYQVRYLVLVTLKCASNVSPLSYVLSCDTRVALLHFNASVYGLACYVLPWFVCAISSSNNNRLTSRCDIAFVTIHSRKRVWRCD